MRLHTYNTTHLNILVILLAAIVLSWSLFNGYSDLHTANHTLARHTAKATAAEIDLLTADLRRGLNVYVEGHSELIARLAADPDNNDLRQKINNDIARHFLSFIAFNLADTDGNIIIEDFGEKFGELCRADLRVFASGGHFSSIIHPGPDIYHFDIMLPWVSQARQGILIASFRPDAITQLLAHNQEPGRRLLITRTDNRRLIEITAAGSRDQLDGINHLEPADITQIESHGASAPVKGGSWNVVELPMAITVENLRQQLFIQIGIVVFSAILLGVLTLKLGNRRLAAETALKAANNKLEQMDQVKDKFLANVSHELRTPVHAILGFSELGEKKTQNEPDGDIYQCFSHIRESGQRLLILLNDLLDLSKLESGHMALHLQEYDLATTVDKSITELEELSHKKNIHVVIETPTVDTTACFDPARMLQVVHNLLSNAIKFTPEGKEITVSFSEDEMPAGQPDTDINIVPALSLSVSNEGIDIPEDELETVFDKFIQSSKTRTDAGGTGLGLAICKEIIERHGGTIQAANREQGGAIFTLTIPRQAVEI
ncbi:MAG: HAMP domain-containing histidine kinase [Gammaproteobacteria bacterium]|nr:HAMP domain-containing histidine kinase [Gammaproteobacteria bacterium]